MSPLSALLMAGAVLGALLLAPLATANAREHGDLFGTVVSRRRNNPVYQYDARDIDRNILSLRQAATESVTLATPINVNVTNLLLQQVPHHSKVHTVQSNVPKTAKTASGDIFKLKSPEIQQRQPWTIPRPSSNPVVHTPIQQTRPSVRLPPAQNRGRQPILQRPPVDLPVTTAGVGSPQKQARQPWHLAPAPAGVAGAPLLGNTVVAQQVPAHCPVYRRVVPQEVCYRNPLLQSMVQPFQCPPQAMIAGVSADEIKKILYDGGYCQSGSECRSSISELLLRLTLLEDRLRAIVKCETRLKIYAELMAQIQQRVGDTVIGHPGLPGEEGGRGQKGPRGPRGPAGKCIKLGTPGSTVGPPGLTGPKGTQGSAGDKICDCDGGVGRLGLPGYSILGNPGLKGTKGLKGPRGQDHNPI